MLFATKRVRRGDVRVLFWDQHVPALVQQGIARVWTWRAIVRRQHTGAVDTGWRVGVPMCGDGRRDRERLLLLHRERLCQHLFVRGVPMPHGDHPRRERLHLPRIVLF